MEGNRPSKLMGSDSQAAWCKWPLAWVKEVAMAEANGLAVAASASWACTEASVRDTNARGNRYSIMMVSPNFAQQSYSFAAQQTYSFY